MKNITHIITVSFLVFVSMCAWGQNFDPYKDVKSQFDSLKLLADGKFDKKLFEWEKEVNAKTSEKRGHLNIDSVSGFNVYECYRDGKPFRYYAEFYYVSINGTEIGNLYDRYYNYLKNFIGATVHNIEVEDGDWTTPIQFESIWGDYYFKVTRTLFGTRKTFIIEVYGKDWKVTK